MGILFRKRETVKSEKKLEKKRDPVCDGYCQQSGCGTQVQPLREGGFSSKGSRIPGEDLAGQLKSVT